MLAHKAILQIERELKRFERSPNRNVVRTLEGVKALLVSSIKFHFGGIDGIKLGDHRKVKNIDHLIEFFNDFCRLPFPVCWFDGNYEGDDDKRKEFGLLLANAEGSERSFDVTPFMLDEESHLFLYMGFRIHGEKGNWSEHRSIIPVLNDMLDDFANLQEVWTAGILKMIGLLNCNNVRRVKVKEPFVWRQVKGKRVKRPIFEHHIIRIIHPKTGRVYFDSSIPTGIHNKLDLRVGHWKKYNADRPLFGKHTGRWWWPSKVECRDESGIVMKEYEVRQVDEENKDGE